MSALSLKILAVLFMLVDHIGFAIGSSGFTALGATGIYWLCRAVGSLALPIFAFLIANGYRHTHSVPKYALRLLVFALVSEVPFDLFVSGKITLLDMRGMIPNPMLDNVFFTLLIGLCLLWLNDLYKKISAKYAKLFSFVTLVFLTAFAGYISADRGVVGVAWIALFGLFDFEDRKQLPFVFMGASVLSYWKIIARCVLVGVYRLTRVNIGRIPGFSYFFAGKMSTLTLIQPFSLFAFGIILLYNNKSGMPKNKVANTLIKYAFYALYPLHLIILYFI